MKKKIYIHLIEKYIKPFQFVDKNINHLNTIKKLIIKKIIAIVVFTYFITLIIFVG